MQALTNKAKPVDRRPMNLWERLYLPAIFKGKSLPYNIPKKPVRSARYSGVCKF